MKKVMVNGTFDILHRGHLELLNYAKSLGNYLLVCIDTDKRVKELKGELRPINRQEDRKFYLDNLKSVDAVWLFDTAEELVLGVASGKYQVSEISVLLNLVKK